MHNYLKKLGLDGLLKIADECQKQPVTAIDKTIGELMGYSEDLLKDLLKLKQDRDFLAMAKKGKRINPEDSLLTKELEKSKHCPHSWRTIVCVDGEDVVECWKCGKQTVKKCNFDEEYD